MLTASLMEHFLHARLCAVPDKLVPSHSPTRQVMLLSPVYRQALRDEVTCEHVAPLGVSAGVSLQCLCSFPAPPPLTPRARLS